MQNGITRSRLRAPRYPQLPRGTKVGSPARAPHAACGQSNLHLYYISTASMGYGRAATAAVHLVGMGASAAIIALTAARLTLSSPPQGEPQQQQHALCLLGYVGEGGISLCTLSYVWAGVSMGATAATALTAALTQKWCANPPNPPPLPPALLSCIAHDLNHNLNDMFLALNSPVSSAACTALPRQLGPPGGTWQQLHACMLLLNCPTHPRTPPPSCAAAAAWAGCWTAHWGR